MVDHSLEINGLDVFYGKKQILNDVSFKLNKGRVTALIGPNGAGKSTSMRVLAGFVKPSAGSYSYKGGSSTDFQELRKHSGYFIESPGFYNYLTARENLKILQQIRPKNATIDSLLELVGLDKARNKKIKQFSKGMKQRLGIAQALIGNPDVLILDEPFHGLDIEVKELLMQVVKNLAAEEQKAILISSHLLNDLEKIADDFVLLHNGRVHYSGNVVDEPGRVHEVRFFFSEKPSEKSIALLKEAGGRLKKDVCELNISRNETKELLRKVVEAGDVPYKVEQISQLQQKYLEIAE